MVRLCHLFLYDLVEIKLSHYFDRLVCCLYNKLAFCVTTLFFFHLFFCRRNALFAGQIRKCLHASLHPPNAICQLLLIGNGSLLPGQNSRGHARSSIALCKHLRYRSFLNTISCLYRPKVDTSFNCCTVTVW